MPRIRKKTSNRASTNHRAKIKHKVAESRKKSKKAAKKNPQWKSKHKKDPGIPSNFPYKDQILAEVAEQRRQAVEERQRRKDGKKAANAAIQGEDGDDQETTFDGVKNLNGQTTSKPKKTNGSGVTEVQDEDLTPVLMNPDLPNLCSVLDAADVIVHVLDARDPVSHRSSHLEELVAAKPGQRILFVVNKIDTCPREILKSWLSHLRSLHPTLPFRSASAFLPTLSQFADKGKAKAQESTEDAFGVESVLRCLANWADIQSNDRPLTVAVVGSANVGKSSFINSLLGKPVLQTYQLTSSMQGPTTTALPQEVTLEASGKQIRIIDTPGLLWISQDNQSPESAEQSRARDILLRNKGRIDRLKDPSPAVTEIVARADTEDLMLLYNLPAFAGGDAEAFLFGIARTNGFIKKRGVLDLTMASRTVLRDWSRGKFPWYTVPPTSTTPSSQLDAEFAELYAKDDLILACLKTRKEMRKDGGVVKFTSRAIDSRKIIVDSTWDGTGDDDEGSESSADTEVEIQDEAADASSSEDESLDQGNGGDDDDMVPTPSLSGTRKRKYGGDQMDKKVTFALDTTSSKKSRHTGSQKAPRTPVPKQKATAFPKKIKSGVIKGPSVVTSTSRNSSDGLGEAYDFKKFF